MMTVNFMPMPLTTFLHSRRGSNTHRKVRIDIGMKQAVYNALPQCALEIVDASGHVWSRGDIRENRGPITLDYLGPAAVKYDPHAKRNKEKADKLLRAVEEARELDKDKQIAEKVAENKAKLEEAERIEAKRKEAELKETNINLMGIHTDEGTTSPESDQRPETKDNDDLQQVGGELGSDGETIRRPVHVQVPLVGSVDARLERTEKRGPEGGSDGLHSSNDEPNVLDNRYAPRVRLISPADEDAGRD